MLPIEVEARNQIVALSGLEQSQVAFNVVPDGTALPYIAVAKINANRGYSHEGFDGTSESLLQTNIYAKSYQEAKQLAQKLYALQEYSSERIRFIEINGEVDGFDNAVDRHSTGLDFRLYHYDN